MLKRAIFVVFEITFTTDTLLFTCSSYSVVNLLKDYSLGQSDETQNEEKWAPLYVNYDIN